jgi:hypothetical protein
MQPNDQFSINAQHRKLLDGYYDIIAHGNPRKIRIDTMEPKTGIDHRTLAKILKHRKDYNGESIRMLSCSTGKLPDGFAKNLANKMNKEVLAPSDILWSGPNGTFSIGPGRMVTNPETGKQEFVRKFPQNGTWKAFNPGKVKDE